MFQILRVGWLPHLFRVNGQVYYIVLHMEVGKGDGRVGKTYGNGLFFAFLLSTHPPFFFLFNFSCGLITSGLFS